MSTDTVLSYDTSPQDPFDRALSLSELRVEAEQLILAMGRPVRRVLLRAGRNEVEVDWETGPATGGPAGSLPSAPPAVPTPGVSGGRGTMETGAGGHAPGTGTAANGAGTAVNGIGTVANGAGTAANGAGTAAHGGTAHGGTAAGAVTAAAGGGAAAGTVTFAVRSPLVGTFYTAPNPGAAPFVQVGDIVRAGDQIALVEAMKLLNPITADRSGKVAAIHVADGEMVEFEQVLVELEPVD